MRAWTQTVGTSAERIFPEPEGTSATRKAGGTPHVLVEIHILNPSGNTGTLYLGGPNSTTSVAGFPLSPGESIKVNAANVKLYGVCSVEQDIRVLVAGAGAD